MSNLINHAKHELILAEADKSFYGELLPNAVLELVEVFARQNHSGMSAPIVIDLFSKLAGYKILSPLTGADDEWCEVSEGLFQNKRLSHVFKENGQAHDNQGRIFEDAGGNRYASRGSSIDIEFPYVPKQVIVKSDNQQQKETAQC